MMFRSCLGMYALGFVSFGMWCSTGYERMAYAMFGLCINQFVWHEVRTVLRELDRVKGKI
jgi:hypothetical protein